MRTGLYNRHLATLGGGERYSLSIAAELSRQGPVDVISHSLVSREAVAERLQLDLGAVRLRVVPERPAAALTPLTAEYDFFVNASNLDFIPPQSRHSAMVVYFPYRQQAGAAAGLRRRLRRELAAEFCLPMWREGVYGEATIGDGPRGARLLAPHAVFELPPQASGCKVFFQLRSAVRTVQQVTVIVDGTPALSLPVGPQIFTPCEVYLPSRGSESSRAGLPHTIAIAAGAVGRTAQFALELRELGIDNRRNKFYRDWFARRLPGWDSRLLNPQPADIICRSGKLQPHLGYFAVYAALGRSLLGLAQRTALPACGRRPFWCSGGGASYGGRRRRKALYSLCRPLFRRPAQQAASGHGCGLSNAWSTTAWWAGSCGWWAA